MTTDPLAPPPEPDVHPSGEPIPAEPPGPGPDPFTPGQPEPGPQPGG